MSKKAETKFKERVIIDLNKLPQSWGFKTQERSRRGVPDIVMCLKGRFVMIELKTDDGRPDPLQMLTIKKIIAAGGVAFSTTPSTWEYHYNLLKNL